MTSPRFDHHGIIVLLVDTEHFFAGVGNDPAPVDNPFTWDANQAETFAGVPPFNNQGVHRAILTSPNDHADLLAPGEAGEVCGEIVLAESVEYQPINFRSGLEKSWLRVEGGIAGSEADDHFHHAFV